MTPNRRFGPTGVLPSWAAGMTYLYDGDVTEARRVLEAVVRQASAANVDSVARMSHYALALTEASAQRGEPARAHLRQGLSGDAGAGLFEAAAIYAMVGPTDSALATLARVEKDTAAANQSPAQFVHAFRGLALLMAGRCPAAVAEVAKAPRAQGPMVLAVRGRCAALAGRKAEAAALRDSVLSEPAPGDPFLSSYIAARSVARGIK